MPNTEMSDTLPPQQVSASLVPLTDEQIELIRRNCTGRMSGEFFCQLFARAIERAHGITGEKAR